MSEIFVRYFHFIGIMLLASALVSQHLLLSKQLTQTQLARIRIVDAIYGISALVVLIAGMFLWVSVGKPAAFYSGNWIFHLKVTLFVVIGGLSVYPSTFYWKKSRQIAAGENVEVPKVLFGLVRAQLVLLIIMPLLAVYISRGIGL